MFSLDQVYEQYRQNQKTAQETVTAIIRHMYQNPAFYQLEQISEDVRQDLMVFCHPHLYLILQNYDASRSSFATFFTYCFNMEKKRFFKEYYRKTSKQKAITEYLMEETVTDAAEPEDAFFFLNTIPLSLEQITAGIPAFKRIRCLSPEQKLLIITLKSCYFLTPSQVTQIARLTGITEAALNELLCTVDRTLDKRIRRITEHNERLNQAYLTRKQILHQLSMVPESGSLHQKLMKSLDHQNDILNRMNREAKDIPALAPSNKVIAEVLNISSTSVSHFLSLLHDKPLKNGILNP
ncbi:MAG: hypothetical protein MJ178_01660 [Treponemataceae bacterium]|nr:hypothetical protein [Treponemataceae bacterium]